MSYTQGVFGSATTAGLPAELRTAIENQLSANGWVLVENYVDTASPANNLDVWRNPAANNSSGRDFYLHLSYKTGGTVLYVDVSEAYNTGTHQMSQGMPIPSSSTGHVADASGCATDVNNIQPGTGTGSILSAQSTSGQVPLSGALGANYVLSITKDRLVTWAAGSTNAWTGYFGLLEPGNVCPADNYLVGATQLFETSLLPSRTGAPIGVTRMPVNAGMSNVYFLAWAYCDSVGIVNDRANGGRTRPTKLIVMDGNGSTSPANVRGWLKDVLFYAITGAVGDTLSVNVAGVAKIYNCIGNNLWVDAAA